MSDFNFCDPWFSIVATNVPSRRGTCNGRSEVIPEECCANWRSIYICVT